MIWKFFLFQNPCFVFGFVKDSRSQQMMMMTTISASSWLVKAMPRKSTPIFASLKSGDGTAVMNEQNGWCKWWWEIDDGNSSSSKTHVLFLDLQKIVWTDDDNDDGNFCFFTAYEAMPRNAQFWPPKKWGWNYSYEQANVWMWCWKFLLLQNAIFCSRICKR